MPRSIRWEPYSEGLDRVAYDCSIPTSTNRSMATSPLQNWAAAERISFKLVSMFYVRKQVLFSLGEFRQGISSFLLRPFSRPFPRGLALPFPESKY